MLKRENKSIERKKKETRKERKKGVNKVISMGL